MALARWQDLCIDAVDADRAVQFWAPALGLTAHPHGRPGVIRLAGETPGRTVWVNTVPETKTVKNRVHLDLRVPLEELVALGATVLREPVGDDQWHVLLDPEGNELCVFSPQEGRSRFYELSVDSEQPGAQAAWWADVLGASVVRDDHPWSWVQDVPGAPFEYLVFDRVPEPKTVKNRVHWDVESDDVDALVAKGATVLRTPDDDVRWHVLADPEGNEFCVFPAD